MFSGGATFSSAHLASPTRVISQRAPPVTLPDANPGIPAPLLPVYYHLGTGKPAFASLTSSPSPGLLACGSQPSSSRASTGRRRETDRGFDWQCHCQCQCSVPSLLPNTFSAHACPRKSLGPPPVLFILLPTSPTRAPALGKTSAPSLGPKEESPESLESPRKMALTWLAWVPMAKGRVW